MRATSRRRRRRRAAADWGVNEDIFDRMPSRRFTRADRRAEHREDADAHRFERRVSGPSRPADAWADEAPRGEDAWGEQALPLRRDDWADEHERRQIAPRRGDWPDRDEPRRTTDEFAAQRRDGERRRATTRRRETSDFPPSAARAAPPSRGPSRRSRAGRGRQALDRLVAGARTPGRNWRSRPARAGPSCSRRRAEPERLAEEPPGRRTVTITGHPDRMPVPRTQRPPRTAIERIGASPDRIVGYAVLLGFVLVLIAVLTTGQ